MKDGNKVLVSELLKEYEMLLPDSKFCRIHKSHIVNLGHVDKYLNGSGGSVVMSNGTSLEVAVRRKKEILDRLRRKNAMAEAYAKALIQSALSLLQNSGTCSVYLICPIFGPQSDSYEKTFVFTTNCRYRSGFL